MSLSDYWGWVRHIKKRGFSFQNVERLLEHLNAGVLNASGRYNPILPSAFSVRPYKAEKKECDQAVITQMLSDFSALSFDESGQ